MKIGCSLGSRSIREIGLKHLSQQHKLGGISHERNMSSCHKLGRWVLKHENATRANHSTHAGLAWQLRERGASRRAEGAQAAFVQAGCARQAVCVQARPQPAIGGYRVFAKDANVCCCPLGHVLNPPCVTADLSLQKEG